MFLINTQTLYGRMVPHSNVSSSANKKLDNAVTALLCCSLESSSAFVASVDVGSIINKKPNNILVFVECCDSKAYPSASTKMVDNICTIFDKNLNDIDT